MSRFVMLSFAFMGWGFYELSGGADFKPPERPAEPERMQVAAKPVVPATQATRITAAAQTSRPVLTRRDNIDASQPSRPIADPGLRQRVAAEHLASAAGILGSTQTAFSDAQAPGALQLASLDGGLAAITAAPAPAPLATQQPSPSLSDVTETLVDRRTIRASRVNMRQGPGTSYPVITRLLGGDEVIVLDDSGTGWLQLRSPDHGQIGWIAASLVSKKRP